MPELKIKVDPNTRDIAVGLHTYVQNDVSNLTLDWILSG